MNSSKRQNIKEEDTNSDLVTDMQELLHREPLHFMLKIESFSESKTEKYESDEFEAGGYKWRLILYPKGDKKRNGSNHISLYLSISDTNSLPQGWEVEANFKLFVYNYVSQKYLTYKLTSETRFNWLKMEWGFAQLIPLDDFKETSNGYLFDDTCVFGAEIYVMSPAAKRQTLSFMKETNANIFTWTVDKFSALSNVRLDSENFMIGDVQWNLWLYPKGFCQDKSISVSLAVSDDELTKRAENGKAINAEYKLRIRNQTNTNHVEKRSTKMFSYFARSWGFQNLIALSDVNDKSKGFLKNDSLVVEVEFTMVGIIKNFK